MSPSLLQGMTTHKRGLRGSRQRFTRIPPVNDGSKEASRTHFQHGSGSMRDSITGFCDKKRHKEECNCFVQHKPYDVAANRVIHKASLIAAEQKRRHDGGAAIAHARAITATYGSAWKRAAPLNPWRRWPICNIVY